MRASHVKWFAVSRRCAGIYNLDDRIKLAYTASETLARAIEQFADYICAETLSEELVQKSADNGYYHQDFVIDGESLSMGVKRVTG